MLFRSMPQDSKLVNAVQLMYSIAILLSTPLQIFPAIRITETELFTRSGKYNPYIKWQKNVFRFFVVALCALIAWGGAADLDKFVALVGSFACVPLVYIYPVSSSLLSRHHAPTVWCQPSQWPSHDRRLTARLDTHANFNSQCFTTAELEAVVCRRFRTSRFASSERWL